MNEIEHKEKLSKIGQRVQLSKTLRELCDNLNAHEVAHSQARENYRSLAIFQPDTFDFKKLPSFGGAIPHDPNIFSWDKTQFLVLSPDGWYICVNREGWTSSPDLRSQKSN